MPIKISREEFLASPNTSNLIHMHTHGMKFTWNNGKYENRCNEEWLDRTIHNATWLSQWSPNSCKTLNKQFSDHHPLLLHFDVYFRRFPRPFRFANIWTEHPDYLLVIKQSWDYLLGFTPNPIVRVIVKVKWVKAMLKQCNWNVLGDVNLKVIEYHKALEEFKNEIAYIGNAQARRNKEKDAISNVARSLHIQEYSYKEKSGNKWLQLRGMCTKYFPMEASIWAMKKIYLQ